jgi:serine/threonine protein kinase
MMTVVTALIAAGIVGPGTVYSVMALCFKPLLRRKLLQCGFRRLADIIVPDVKSDVRLMSVKMNELEAFVSKQKLPRFLDITPEIEASEIELDDKNVLGAGGYGAVFQASYKGALVAVKALLGIDSTTPAPANVVKMMRREATIMCSLNHPNIIRVHGIVPARGWIVMELCEGGALDDYIRDTEEMMDASVKSRICSEIATGIAYLHMRDVSVVHGDLKAANVLLTRDKSVRLCDFGMSETKNRSKTMTASNAGSGAALTVAWSAPELFEDDPKSFATDVYALGVTLWEVYERRVPFGNMPEAAVVNQILSGKRPKFSTSETPSNVKRIIEACWSADPRKRPTADKIAYILTDLWTRDAQWNQQRGTSRLVIDETAVSQTSGSLVDDALGSSKSAEEEDVVIELKEGEVTT